MLSVIITLIGGIALWSLPVAQYPRITPPGVTVAISYPGANSQIVADTVAAPIEQEVNGVPGMLYMSSQCANDGTYSLTVTFDIDVDLKTALVMVQNRVALAMPQLPTEVQNQGITIRKRTPDMLMIVNLISPDDSRDDIYLSNYATIYLKDELLRVPGVSDINYQGQRDYSIRIWLDPDKLAAKSMTALDVAQAVRSQNLDAPAGQVGQPPSLSEQLFQLPIRTLGRLHTPEQFGDIVVKVAQEGAMPSAPSARASARPSSGLPTMGPLPTIASDNDPNSTTPTFMPSTTGTDAGTTSAGTPPAITTSSTTPPATTTPPASSTPPTSSSTPGSTASGNTASNTDTTAISGGLPGASAGAAGGSAQQRSVCTAVVRLRDVARISLGAQNYNQSCLFDGKPSVGLGIYQLPGTNALEVSDAVRKRMDELKTRFPAGVDYDIAYDTTPYIRQSVDDVLFTLVVAVVLVGIVVLFFLQDWRTMILPMIDVPVSLIGTFAVMAALGFTLNNLTLFGLVLAIGIVVDDAIVVLENIERLIATGLEPRAATLAAMNEVTGPIVAVALVLCAVFVPCAFVGGITGQFFRQFAVTIAVSTVISAINAITMTPSRAVLIFKAEARDQGSGVRGQESVASSPTPHPSPRAPHKEALPWWSFAVLGGLLTVWQASRLGLPSAEGEGSRWLSWAITALDFTPGALAGGLLGWFLIRPVNAVLGWVFRGFNRLFDGLTAVYGWTLARVLRLSALVLITYVGLLGLTYWIFSRAPTGFIPQQDQGRLIVNLQLPDAASLQRTRDAVAAVDRIARATPGVRHTVGIAGMSFLLQANSPNFASMFIVLDPFDKRTDPSLRDTAIMKRLRKAWAREVKDAEVTVFGASPVPGLGSAGGFKLIIEDRGDMGMPALEAQTRKMVRGLKEIPHPARPGQPGLNNVSTQIRSNMPQVFLDIDRTKVASLGINLTDVNQTLSIYQGSLYVNSFNEFGRHWQVTLQAEGIYRNQVEDLSRLKVRNRRGEMVTLGTLLTVREVGGPITVTRYNLYTASSIRGSIETGYSDGDAIKRMEQLANESLPISMKADWTELMFMQKLAGNTATYIFLLSVVCVFLALAALYESWALPLAVILVVPLSLLCSVAGILFSQRDVNIFVQIGLVVLVGLACKNAILIVEYARQLHQEGRSCFEATVVASRLRLRPILMTSFAFILGVVPLMVAMGAGAEMRRSLGIAVFSGMLGVTVFGVYLTPVFFYVIQGLGESQVLSSPALRWSLSGAAGSLLGLALGFVLGKLGLAPLPWSAIVGACAGAPLILIAIALQRRLRLRLAARRPLVRVSAQGRSPRPPSLVSGKDSQP